jgi:putative tryptophan/tyrosine transport system substrate-binding protein
MRVGGLKRREFITLLGGSVAAWPVAVRAQQPARMRRIAFLWNLDPNDPVGKSWIAALMQGLAGLGWIEGRNLRIDVRWDPRTPEQIRIFADELIALRPDVLVTGTQRLTLALQGMTKTIPIVFVGAGDPLAGGIIRNAAHPGGNTTGVTDLLTGFGSKWLELLKECMPSLARVAMIQNSDLASPTRAAPTSTAASVTEAAAQYGVTVSEVLVRNPDEIERAISAFAATPGGGLIVLPPPLPGAQRKLVNGLAIRYGLPVLYQDRSFAVDGGLLAYGTDMIYMFGHDAPPYIDRILRGEKPGDLPVQYPTKFILTVNLRTAKAMGLKIPESFLLRADELIE